MHAKAAQEADPALPMAAFVRGRLLFYEAGNAKGRRTRSRRRSTWPAGQQRATRRALSLPRRVAGAHLDRYAEAEAQYREEFAFRAASRPIPAWRCSTRRRTAIGGVEDVLNELVAATPTPEGYAVAARLWTILGDRTRAEALRSDARARFGGSVAGASRAGCAAISINPTPTQARLRDFLIIASVTPGGRWPQPAAAMPPERRLVDAQAERDELERDDDGAIERREDDRLAIDRRRRSSAGVRNTSRNATA